MPQGPLLEKRRDPGRLRTDVLGLGPTHNVGCGAFVRRGLETLPGSHKAPGDRDTPPLKGAASVLSQAQLRARLLVQPRQGLLRGPEHSAHPVYPQFSLGPTPGSQSPCNVLTPADKLSQGLHTLSSTSEGSPTTSPQSPTGRTRARPQGRMVWLWGAGALLPVCPEPLPALTASTPQPRKRWQN